MPKFTLRQLEYFRAVALNGSISAAAEAERVSRSSVAAALDDLESALGSALCIRTKAQGIDLTANGRIILASVETILDDVAELQQLGSGTELSGTLTIGCFPSLAPTMIPLLWQDFARDHPKVKLDVVTGSRSELVEKLARGEVDLVLAYNLHEFDSVESAALYDTCMHAILAPEHPLASQPSVSAADLAEEPLLLMDVPPSADDILGYFSSLGLSPRIGLRSQQFEFIRSLVARGAGYSLFIQRPRTSTSYEGLPVVALRVVPAPPLERAGIGWSSRRRLSRRSRAFIDLVRARAADLAPEPV
ncbi:MULTISPECIES: LysR substrate-binding domain-containing protein [unclassified Arthrobacter]|uniref:LysR substrate-binding domain-containing protein n=1 Tax=unclassified Arthrobacter TaxID=235627 RepID=UPI0021062092|nr:MULTISPECIES: LysR substrate-binding domain-containing protein [unclassified Arthrobacter]MCQ1985661.1 LysR substrate-binding domain-containing protein [Arthrobacter sp. zg-Y844]MCQ1994622.1 LysR substrate-binding domain-containing protein [Arthrobacter sp. zg-Y1171]UWX81299.1 LysR substrate-binding domain-containing protein [Arthrobacter sp. zg-Y1171]